ncbi:hypothetical protein EB093_06465 [bacterium]|nr:hypothetical protein [bacterium]
MILPTIHRYISQSAPDKSSDERLFNAILSELGIVRRPIQLLNLKKNVLTFTVPLKYISPQKQRTSYVRYKFELPKHWTNYLITRHFTMYS